MKNDVPCELNIQHYTTVNTKEHASTTITNKHIHHCTH